MNLVNNLSTWDDYTNGANIKTLRAIVEIPKGSRVKYEFDPSGSYLTPVRELDPQYPYPFNYGSIPQTLAEDNDPLDIIIIDEESFAPGVVVNCKVVGVVTTVDNGEEDDKIIAIPYFSPLKKIGIKEILNYLSHYKYPDQAGTQVKQVLGAKAARALINKAVIKFNNSVKKENSKNEAGRHRRTL